VSKLFEAYLQQYPQDAQNPGEVRRAIAWLKRLADPIDVSIQPLALEEYAWMRSAAVGFKVFHKTNELLYMKPVEIDGKKDISSGQQPLVVPWRPGDEIELQLLDDTAVVERRFLGADLLKRLTAGNLAQDVTLDIAKGNQKARFRVGVTSPPERPPLLP
jgi:hypothetical protein